jgi:hypothetical protein
MKYSTGSSGNEGIVRVPTYYDHWVGLLNIYFLLEGFKTDLIFFLRLGVDFALSFDPLFGLFLSFRNFSYTHLCCSTFFHFQL